jgi:hypothetical protein
LTKKVHVASRDMDWLSQILAKKKPLIGKAAELTAALKLSYRMCCPFSIKFAAMTTTVKIRFHLLIHFLASRSFIYTQASFSLVSFSIGLILLILYGHLQIFVRASIEATRRCKEQMPRSTILYIGLSRFLILMTLGLLGSYNAKCAYGGLRYGTVGV